MIISERQIMQLFEVVSIISTSPVGSYIPEESKLDMARLINEITNQQPDKLIEIKDEK